VLRSKSKRWLSKALLRSSILSFATRLVARNAAILMYHSVVGDPQLTDHILGISRARASFERHMQTLARNFSPVTIDDIVQFAKSGRDLPPRAVAVTFDDGFADNYDVALPILNRYGVPATFYVMVAAVANGVLPWYCSIRSAFYNTQKSECLIPGCVGTFRLTSPEERNQAMTAAWEQGARMTGNRQDEFVRRMEHELEVDPVKCQHGLMMNWNQVRALRKAGHSVGAHTLSHPNLAHVSETEARSEIVESKKRLETEIGEPVEHFSYPHPALNPQWSARTLAITREAGFKSAVLTTHGPVRAGDEPLALKRINTPPDCDQFAVNLYRTFLDR
jgi:peptidoglycan/xylan/chitin deacetylase (PgdA/CDA1 family)